MIMHSSRPRGISLIEMLTVTVLISVLAIILVPLSGLDDVSKREQDLRSTLRDIRTAISKYRKDMYGFPAVVGIMQNSPAIQTAGANAILKDAVEVALLHPNHMPLDREDFGIDFANRSAFMKDVKKPDGSVYISSMSWTGDTLNNISVKAYIGGPPYVANGADPVLPFRTMCYFEAREIATGDVIYKFKGFNREADGLFDGSELEVYYDKYETGTSEILWSRVAKTPADWSVWRSRVIPPYMRGDGRVARFDNADAPGFPANPMAITGGNYQAASDQWEVLLNISLPPPGTSDYTDLRTYLSDAGDGITAEQILKPPAQRETLWWPVTQSRVSWEDFIYHVTNHMMVNIAGGPAWGGYSIAQINTDFGGGYRARRDAMRVLSNYITVTDIRSPCNFAGVVGLSGTTRSQSSSVTYVNGAAWDLSAHPFLVPRRMEDNLTLGKDSYYWEL